MTRLLEKAFDAARVASPEMQDELARVLLSYLGDGASPMFALTPEDQDAVRRSRDAVARGEIATDEEMEAIWAKYGL